MKTGYKIIYSPEALDDLRSIYLYIAEELLAEQAAANQVSRIRKEIRRLDTFPEKHEFVEWEPWHSMGMRWFPINNYNVYYLIEEQDETVSIVRIFYSGRDIEHIIRGNLE